MSYGGHPAPRQIKAYAQRRSSPVEEQWIQEHLGCCINCYRTFRLAGPKPILIPGPARQRAPVAERARPSAGPVPVPDSPTLWRAPKNHREISPRAPLPGIKGPLMGRGLTSPPIVDALFSAAVRSLPDEQQERYGEEWRADLRQIHSRLWATMWALQIRLYSARSLRRLHGNMRSKEAS